MRHSCPLVGPEGGCGSQVRSCTPHSRTRCSAVRLQFSTPCSTGRSCQDQVRQRVQTNHTSTPMWLLSANKQVDCSFRQICCTFANDLLGLDSALTSTFRPSPSAAGPRCAACSQRCIRARPGTAPFSSLLLSHSAEPGRLGSLISTYSQPLRHTCRLVGTNGTTLRAVPQRQAQVIKASLHSLCARSLAGVSRAHRYWLLVFVRFLSSATTCFVT